MKNDSGLPADEVIARLTTEGVPISYGELTLQVEKAALADVRARVASWTTEERQRAYPSVDQALWKAYPKIGRGGMSKKLMDRFYADMMLWEALKGTDAWYDFPILSDAHAEFCKREAVARYGIKLITETECGMLLVEDENGIPHTDAVLRALSFYKRNPADYAELEPPV